MEWRQIGLRGLRLVMRWNVEYRGFTFQVRGEVFPDASPEIDFGIFDVMHEGVLLGSSDCRRGAGEIIEAFHEGYVTSAAMGDEDTDNGCAPDEPSDDFPMWLEYPDENDPSQWDVGNMDPYEPYEPQ